MLHLDNELVLKGLGKGVSIPANQSASFGLMKNPNYTIQYLSQYLLISLLHLDWFLLNLVVLKIVSIPANQSASFGLLLGVFFCVL